MSDAPDDTGQEDDPQPVETTDLTDPVEIPSGPATR